MNLRPVCRKQCGPKLQQRMHPTPPEGQDHRDEVGGKIAQHVYPNSPMTVSAPPPLRQAAGGRSRGAQPYLDRLLTSGTR